jgi:hypothetical protein
MFKEKTLRDWPFNVFWEGVFLRFMVFNATFNNISVISLRSVVEETGVHGENH